MHIIGRLCPVLTRHCAKRKHRLLLHVMSEILQKIEILLVLLQGFAFTNFRHALVMQALLRNNVRACRSALKAETVDRIRNDLIRLIPA